jgi:hypothetical protein
VCYVEGARRLRCECVLCGGCEKIEVWVCVFSGGCEKIVVWMCVMRGGCEKTKV